MPTIEDFTYKGAGPTVIRAMVVNGAQLAAYSQAKENLLGTNYFKEGILLHFCASMISGLITTIASMPVDIVKTRVQRASGKANALVSYNLLINFQILLRFKTFISFLKKIFTEIIKNEGVLSLWKGFTPYYARLGPHTVLTFIFLEQFNKMYRNYAKQ